MSTIHILIINPNTTQSMTESLKSSISVPSDVTVDYFTAPQSEGGIASINSPSDAHLSATHCLPHLLPLLDEDKYDGFLVACYSEHPLVGILATEIQAKKRKKRAHVIGIFEASVLTALGLLSSYPPSLKAKWGIVSTGKIWEEALSTGVTNFLGTQTSPTTFAGVETTGLFRG
ncbi:hypothetical protein VNI00_006713 [Paramarasmius palmivorus]|uniref:Asp/Glu/hydantoin racemase n=1 Tax=Paramarasmius palmivorus TaxID=297713 RepID=A0AAW0DB18_9AGAR